MKSFKEYCWWKVKTIEEIIINFIRKKVANSVKEKCGTLKEELSRLTKDNESALSRVEAKYQKQLDSQKEEHEAELARRSCEDGAQHHVDIQEMAKAYQE